MIPPFFCCHNMKDARGNERHLTILPDRKRAKGWQKKYHLTHRIKTASTEITKPGYYASDPQSCQTASDISARGNSMTNAREHDAFNLVVERHQLGASENGIGVSFPTFPRNSRGRHPRPSKPPRAHQESATLVGWTSTSTTRASNSKRTSYVVERS